MHTTALAAKITARNLVNAELRASVPTLLSALAPFVGTKINKATGGFTKKFIDAMPKLGSHWQPANYSLTRTFRACENGPRSAQYQEATVYLGEINNEGVLTKIEQVNFDYFRTDYTEAEILTARALVTQARDTMQKAESRLRNFGEYDN